jgi:hypothetical protein
MIDEGIQDQLVLNGVQDVVIVKLTGFKVSNRQIENVKDEHAFLFDLIDIEHTKYGALLNQAQDFFDKNPSHEVVNIPLVDSYRGYVEATDPSYASITFSREQANGIGAQGRLMSRWIDYKRSLRINDRSILDKSYATPMNYLTEERLGSITAKFRDMKYKDRNNAISRLDRMVEQTCLTGRGRG